MDSVVINLIFIQSTGFSYSMANCLYASMIHRIETKCNCSPFFATMSNTEAGNVEQWPTCEGEGLVCKEAVMLNWGDEEAGLDRVLNTKTGRLTECLPVRECILIGRLH